MSIRKLKPLPPLEKLKEMFVYKEDEGLLFWKERPRHHFPSDGRFSRWNKLHPGRQAGSVSKISGYVIISIDRSCYKAHRLIWYMHTGEDPGTIMDHINHNRSDNRFSNLRKASYVSNAQNRSINCRNKSGCPGVKFYPEYNSWVVSIKVNYKAIHLGSFKDKDEAIRARRAAEIKYGYHKNHGRTISHYRKRNENEIFG
ncbi:HNH endonuclease signature motif containing protein [Mixta calida]|uniref:HNH endonuclease signature motif containing protein n=1 Tax=Mixta calida TaxID=665913 RepID=UPI0028A1DADF|nr:HNH endonuclease signature motif containing protein [Mixta calida]